MNIAKKLKHIIRWFTPFGVVRMYMRNHSKAQPDMPQPHRFMSAFKEYCSSASYVSLLDTCPFKQIISVQGFGYSGSGAVLDLLREYDSNIVVGFIDNEGSVADATNALSYEVDMMRLAGGLLEFEKYLDCNNLFQNDALLHRFIDLVEYSELYQNLPQVRPYFFEFFRNVTDIYHKDTIIGRHNNPHLDYKGNTEILFLKKQSLAEYRLLCRKLLYSIFAVYKVDTKCDNLVLDQLFSDLEFDIERNLAYVPELKTIAVYRDPRDVYTFAKRVNEEWIAHHDAHTFVAWYNTILSRFNVTEKTNYLVIRFEDLVNDYAKTIKIIETYLSLDANHHTSPKSAFDPEQSAKNVRVWHDENELAQEFEYIKKQLSYLCYKE